MSSLATDIARHEKRMNDEAIADERLEDAKKRFRHAVLHNHPLPIYAPGEHGLNGVSDQYEHKDALIEWDSDELWQALRCLHWDLVHASDGQPVQSTLDALRTALDDALDEAAERCAPMMLAAEDKQTAEWNDSLREPVDEMFFRRLG